MTISLAGYKPIDLDMYHFPNPAYTNDEYAAYHSVIKPIVISWAEGLNKYNAIALLAAVLYITDDTPTDAQLEHQSEPGGAELGMREFVLHHLGKRTKMGKLLSALPSQMDDFINAALGGKWEAGYIGPRVHRYHASVSVTEGPIEYHVRRWTAAGARRRGRAADRNVSGGC